MEVDIDTVIVRKRIRKNLGDLTSLMESLARHGLLNPVVVNSRNELVAGHRRLESAKRLGWKKIDVRIVESEDEISQMEMEIEENTQRKSLTTDELADAYLRLDKLKNPTFFQRLWRAVSGFFSRLGRWISERFFRRKKSNRPT
jgi:ParB family chromosome partitioning protein